MNVGSQSSGPLTTDIVNQYLPPRDGLTTLGSKTYHSTWLGAPDPAIGYTDLDLYLNRFGMAWTPFAGLLDTVSVFDPDSETFQTVSVHIYPGNTLEETYIMAPPWAVTPTALASLLTNSDALMYGVNYNGPLNLPIGLTNWPGANADFQISTSAYLTSHGAVNDDALYYADPPMLVWADYTNARRQNGAYAVFTFGDEDTTLGQELADLGRPVIFAIDGTGSAFDQASFISNVMNAYAAAAPGNSTPYIVMMGWDYGSIMADYAVSDDKPSFTVTSGVGINSGSAAAASAAVASAGSVHGGGDTAESMYEPVYWGIRKSGFTSPVVVWFTDTVPVAAFGPGILTTLAPPARLYPREDGLGVGGGRLWPPHRSQQSGRLAGGYY